MTQTPFKVDALQVEPGSGQTLLIERIGPSGELQFRDAVVAAGLRLSQMAGQSTVTGVLVVGRAGTGAQYTSLQAALDAVPVSSSTTNPYVVVVYPGVYTGNFTLNRSGVTVVALGRVVLTPTTATPTLTVTAGVSSTPLQALVVGVTFLQPNDGVACVSLVGGAASTVGSGGLVFRSCEFVATGVGSYTVYADTVNRVELRHCTAIGSVATATLRVRNCAELRVEGGDLPLVQADYDTALARPSVTTSAYLLQGCLAVGNVLSTLTSAGSLSLVHCGTVGTLTVNGNRTLTLLGCGVGAVTVNGTTAATVTATRRGALAGGGTWTEPLLTGQAVFVAATTGTVTFAVPRPDSTYVVVMDSGVNANPWVTAKTATGFTINFSSVQTTTVAWTVLAG